MNLSEYQKRIEDTWISNENDTNRIICGLFEEVGEIAGKFKKYFRKDFNYYQLELFLKKEIGDVFYYLVKLCSHYDLNAEDILQENIAKLKDRQNRGVLKGSGDNR